MAALALWQTGCKTDKDAPEPGIDRPVITIVSLSVPAQSTLLCGSLYENVLKIHTGTELQLTMRLQSNRPLSQYKIDAHSNFDCHAHGSKTTAIPWTVLKIENISGTDTTVTETLVIPPDAASGNYHLMIRLLDEDGREAEFAEFNVIITNPEDTQPPTIVLTSPTEDSIAVATGATLVFDGQIYDNRALHGGKYEIVYTDAAGMLYKTTQVFFPENTATDYHLQYSYTIPAFAAKGTAHFECRVYDAAFNATVKNLKVHIL